MLNKSGKFTSPGLRGIQASASVLPKKITDFAQLKIVEPAEEAGKLAYPIWTFTYVIAPTIVARRPTCGSSSTGP